MAAGHSPLAQFEIKTIYSLPEVFGIDMSLTNTSMWMLLSILGVALFFALAMRKQAVVPGRMQSLAEMTYEFVEGIVDENAGHEGRKFFPFILTLFLFILFMNLFGMLPYSFTPTSHIIVTFAMGALVFLGVVVVGLIKQGPVGFFKHFIPEGLPLLLVPLVFAIELVSYLSRPFSLGIRLAANMTAGHTMMKVIAGFVVPLGVFGVAPVAFLVFMTGFEIFVAILQAYVFALLACMYLGEALADHH
ncbi:MAG: F0F1 ATP synthase subunit A [Azospirillum brasilense]|nr:MAG: F0F1 ATP synthase subunit A [Azospirillum brasilense]